MTAQDATTFSGYSVANAAAVLGVLKAIDCYEYQSCETPDWDRSEARSFCNALRGRLTRALPGYESAPTWDYSGREAA